MLKIKSEIKQWKANTKEWYQVFRQDKNGNVIELLNSTDLEKCVIKYRKSKLRYGVVRVVKMRQYPNENPIVYQTVLN